MSENNKPEKDKNEKKQISLSELHSAIKDLMIEEYEAEERLKSIKTQKNNAIKMLMEANVSIQKQMVLIQKAFPDAMEKVGNNRIIIPEKKIVTP